MYSEKQTKPNNLFALFLCQFSALLSPFIKLFELCICYVNFLFSLTSFAIIPT